MSNVRRCAVRQCPVRVPMEHLMCGPHWSRVSAATKDAVQTAWKTFMRGEIGLVEYWRTARVAVEEVGNGAK